MSAVSRPCLWIIMNCRERWCLGTYQIWKDGKSLPGVSKKEETSVPRQSSLQHSNIPAQGPRPPFVTAIDDMNTLCTSSG